MKLSLSYLCSWSSMVLRVSRLSPNWTLPTRLETAAQAKISTGSVNKHTHYSKYTPHCWFRRTGFVSNKNNHKLDILKGFTTKDRTVNDWMKAVASCSWKSNYLGRPIAIIFLFTRSLLVWSQSRSLTTEWQDSSKGSSRLLLYQSSLEGMFSYATYWVLSAEESIQ
jgi:hypothetical protein